MAKPTGGKIDVPEETSDDAKIVSAAEATNWEEGGENNFSS